MLPFIICRSENYMYVCSVYFIICPALLRGISIILLQPSKHHFSTQTQNVPRKPQAQLQSLRPHRLSTTKMVLENAVQLLQAPISYGHGISKSKVSLTVTVGRQYEGPNPGWASMPSSASVSEQTCLRHPEMRLSELLPKRNTGDKTLGIYY